MEQPDCLASVAAFHRLFQCPILDTPTIPSAERCKLRVKLIQEELSELEEAIDQHDIIEVADALADIQYVLSGAVLEFGMGSLFKQLFEEVQRSNMSKACATAEEASATQKHYKSTKGFDSTVEKVGPSKFLVYRANDKKVLKSVNYSPANLVHILSQEAGSQTQVGGDHFVMPNTLDAVAAFHNLFRAPVLEEPTIPSKDRCALRISLISEELKELEQAIADKDIVEMADALADIQYVLTGSILEFGMGSLFKQLFDEVQRSNMSKACATMEEAKATQKHYKEVYKPQTESTVQEVGDLFLVYRKGDRKVLKSINYSKVNFHKMLGAYIKKTVPIHSVARVIRLNTKGEDSAAQLDCFFRGEALNPVRAFDGFLKLQRQLCKAEWAYEVSLIFSSNDCLLKFLASDANAIISSASATSFLKTCAVDGKIYVGSRVHDEF